MSKFKYQKVLLITITIIVIAIIFAPTVFAAPDSSQV